jgi:hypothetical protein
MLGPGWLRVKVAPHRHGRATGRAKQIVRGVYYKFLDEYMRYYSHY